jgi:outer membrane murein-binding lipoprotein Lpp
MIPAQPTPQAPRPVPVVVRLGLRSPREVIFRLVIVAVILSSVGLAWWSFAKILPPLQDKGRELSAAVSRLGTEVDELDRQWPKAAAEQVAKSYQLVRGELFSNEGAFANWLANLNGQASSLTLDAKADFGKTAPVPAPGEKLATLPATIVIEVRSPAAEGPAQSPYQRVVQLTEQLCAGKRRTDLAELRLSGGAGSITRVVVVLDLWAGEEKPRP